ncbi:MAG: sulfur globule protein precursor [Deltaproteobacteria bacterium]|nr:sulfur globule protein precursor [Deltaproteobacteria bacterium]
MKWTLFVVVLALVAALSIGAPAYAHWRGGTYGGYWGGYGWGPYHYGWSGYSGPAVTYYYGGYPGYYYWGPKHKKFGRMGYRTYYRW